MAKFKKYEAQSTQSDSHPISTAEIEAAVDELLVDQPKKERKPFVPQPRYDLVCADGTLIRFMPYPVPSKRVVAGKIIINGEEVTFQTTSGKQKKGEGVNQYFYLTVNFDGNKIAGYTRELTPDTSYGLKFTAVADLPKREFFKKKGAAAEAEGEAVAA